MLNSLYFSCFFFPVCVWPANGCETVAVAQEDGTYKLYGYKWFSSATDSDMTLTLGTFRSSSDLGHVFQISLKHLL